jgi:hypothetical protein
MISLEKRGRTSSVGGLDGCCDRGAQYRASAVISENPERRGRTMSVDAN